MENKFEWTDALVKEATKEFVNKFTYPNRHNYTWEGIEREVEKFKASKTPIPLMAEKDKEFEILSFISKYEGDDDVLFKVNKSGVYHPQGRCVPLTYTLSYLLNQPTVKIHSVRRNSDMQVFTVGEEVNYGVIENFSIDELGLRTHFTNGNGATLASIKKKNIIKNKEFEILSFKSSLGEICKLRDNGFYAYDTHGWWALDVMLSDCTFKIHSVKRNSDGEIFSIGDIISGVSYDSREITGFDISEIGLRIKQYGGFSELQYIKKAEKKEPTILFTTTDGIPIYDNDRVIWTITGAGQIVVSSAEFVNPSLKYFSSKEKAEEYKLWSEKRYSLNVIKSVLDKFISPIKNEIINELKKQ